MLTKGNTHRGFDLLRAEVQGHLCILIFGVKLFRPQPIQQHPTLEQPLSNMHPRTDRPLPNRGAFWGEGRKAQMYTLNIPEHNLLAHRRCQGMVTVKKIPLLIILFIGTYSFKEDNLIRGTTTGGVISADHGIIGGQVVATGLITVLSARADWSTFDLGSIGFLRVTGGEECIAVLSSFTPSSTIPLAQLLTLRGRGGQTDGKDCVKVASLLCLNRRDGGGRTVMKMTILVHAHAGNC